MNHQLRKATTADARALADLAAETFVETFRSQYPPDDLNLFLHQSYAVETIRNHIAAPDQLWLIAEDDAGDPIGYAQSGPCALPHPDASSVEGEIKRIYVRESAKGSGLASRLMEQSLAWIEAAFGGSAWLGVWSENHRALRFYARFGFEKVGDYDFVVGSTRDHEFILRRPRLS